MAPAVPCRRTHRSAPPVTALARLKLPMRDRHRRRLDRQLAALARRFPALRGLVGLAEARPGVILRLPLGLLLIAGGFLGFLPILGFWMIPLGLLILVSLGRTRLGSLPALTQVEREDIRRLASYPHNTAGAIMTSDHAVLTGKLSASEALQKLRQEALDQETIYRTYVIDADRRLLGSVRLQDLFLAPAKARISDVMERNTHAVTVTDDREEVAQRVARYDLLALPVVDAEGRLVGIVTHDDALDVMQEEATEDFHRVGASNLVRNMRDASVFMLCRARIVWLLLLVFGNIFSGAGIAYFEDTITAYVALVFFLPLLIDSGGNAGSQSATLMVRSLATGEVQIKDWSWMIGREVMVAALMGLSMALAVSVIGIFRAGPEIAVVVATSMILIVIVGSVIGMLLPFVLTKLNLDPATASAPLVTSIADAAGVLIYFAIATAFLFPTI